MYYLAFRVPSPQGGPSRLFWGTETFPEDFQPNITWEPTTPDQVRANDVYALSHQVFSIDEPLALALQLESQGWHDLAISIVKRRPVNLPSRREPITLTFLSADMSPEQRLNHLAWGHWCNVFRDRDSNRQAIKEHLDALFKVEPPLRDDPPKAEFIEALALALQPATSAPGSVESEIGGLCEVSGHPYYWNQPGPQGVWTDPHFIALAEKGFAAVPALLKHMDDRRLTRSVQFGSMMTPRYLSVGDLARLIIVNIAGMPLDRDPGDRRALQQWWDAAQKEDEASYMSAHVFPDQPEGHWRFACRLMLTILAKRHPETLPGLFKTMIKAAESNSQQRPAASHVMIATYSLVPQILTSELSLQDTKIELLLQATRDPASQLSAPAREELTRFTPSDIARIEAKVVGGK
jgi:hypothetical protein